jgi:DNA-binding transcriptional ArsR family regulator
MLRATHRSSARKREQHAARFAALGDATRLLLLAKLGRGNKASISQLTGGSKLTRQAVTKHLRVLESAGIVHSRRNGRERLFEFNPDPIVEIKDYLERVAEHWDERLARLKSLVE